MKRKKRNTDGGESFPCFRCPVNPIFEELKSGIFDISRNLWKFFRVVHV